MISGFMIPMIDGFSGGVEMPLEDLRSQVFGEFHVPNGNQSGDFFFSWNGHATKTSPYLAWSSWSLRMIWITGFCQKSFIVGMMVLYLMSAGKGMGCLAYSSGGH